MGDTAARAWTLLQCLDTPGFEARAVKFRDPVFGDAVVKISSAGPALMYPAICVCVCVCVCVYAVFSLCLCGVYVNAYIGCVVRCTVSGQRRFSILTNARCMPVHKLRDNVNELVCSFVRVTPFPIFPLEPSPLRLASMSSIFRFCARRERWYAEHLLSCFWMLLQLMRMPIFERNDGFWRC